MNAKKYLPIALFIGLQAFALQALDQAVCANIPPLAAGGGWISFQAWAMYFLGGCTPKGGLRALIGYVIGMAASIAIMVGGGALGALLAMHLFRHKTRHWKFRAGIPFLMLLQCALVLWILRVDLNI